MARASTRKVPNRLVWDKAEYTGQGSFDNRIVHMQVDMLQATREIVRAPATRPDCQYYARKVLTVIDRACAWNNIVVEKEKNLKYQPLA